MLRTYDLNTERNGLYDITEQVKQTIEASGVEEGLAVVFIPHTTAGVTIYSWPDPLGFEDVDEEVSRLVPTRINFKHQHDTPQDAAGHVKSSLIGVSLTVIISDGKLLVGHSQNVYFFEFDGPRQRKFHVKVVAG
ncbi:MAG: YjbQ family protein [Chloroflexi bacterium]|nr:YjbQ family protein [Chloroflexota bacterium]